MSARVYQYGLLPPTEGEELVRQQMRAAHQYRNDLVAIERGRRGAMRAVDDASSDVQIAKEELRGCARSDRKDLLRRLQAARRAARAAAADELARIATLDESIRRDARALTDTYWGTYLGIEAANQQARGKPLYGADGMTANDPAFARGPRWQDALPPGDLRRHWWLAESRIGVQIARGISTSDALSCEDTRVRLDVGPPGRTGRRYGTLSVRVGSTGRDPIWARWPIKLHRDLPVGAIWKWVHVSVRTEGYREIWTVEITVDTPDAPAVDGGGHGAVAVEWEWTPADDGSVRVARWRDDRGTDGEVVLPAVIAEGIRRPDGIRAVRDLVLNDMRDRLIREIRETAPRCPEFVLRASASMHLWRSPSRFIALGIQWRRHLGADAPPVKIVRRGGKHDPVCLSSEHSAYAILAEWARREWHLRQFECCSSRQAIRRRRDWYRCLSADWARRYATVLLSDQDLSREARFGDDADVRHTVGPSELRDCLRKAFGEARAVGARWRDGAAEDDERPWCERTIDAWTAGGACGDGRFAERKEKTVNAWAARKAKKRVRAAAEETARNAAGTCAE